MLHTYSVNFPPRITMRSLLPLQCRFPRFGGPKECAGAACVPKTTKAQTKIVIFIIAIRADQGVSKSHNKLYLLVSSYTETLGMVSLATSFGGIDLDCCVYNASGPRTGTTEMLAMVRSCVQVPRLRCVAALSSTHTFLQFFSICLPPFIPPHIAADWRV